jgi:type III secretion system low calcium response chaperone LcrH/SycD
MQYEQIIKMKENPQKIRISQEAKLKIKNKALCKKELSQGKSGQEMAGFSDEAMSTFFHAANTIFKEQRYQEAAEAFLFLAMLDQGRHEYWLGLGMATQMCHQYEAAIDAYEIAALCDITSPVAYFYLGKCLFAVHDRENALRALDLAIENAGEEERFVELKNQAIEAKNILLKAMYDVENGNEDENEER